MLRGWATPACSCRLYRRSLSASSASMAWHTGCEGSYAAEMAGREALSAAMRAQATPASCDAARSCSSQSALKRTPRWAFNTQMGKGETQQGLAGAVCVQEETLPAELHG